VFRRDAKGNILDRLDVGTARQENGGWTLYDVIRRSVDDIRPEAIAALPWPHPIRLDVIAMLSVDPQELPLSVIDLIIASDGFGQLSTDLYRASFHHRLANPLSPLIMLFLAVGLARAGDIRRGPTLFLLSGLALGFGYFIYDGVLLAVAEAGWLPGWLASWSPKIVMTCLISVLVLRT
jgi:lipopolysaccharide export system permease protein